MNEADYFEWREVFVILMNKFSWLLSNIEREKKRADSAVIDMTKNN